MQTGFCVFFVYRYINITKWKYYGTFVSKSDKRCKNVCVYVILSDFNKPPTILHLNKVKIFNRQLHEIQISV